jgi:poly(A) polymerase
VTDPISTNGPEVADEERTKKLTEALDGDAPPDTAERRKLRETVLQDLQKCAREWILEEGLSTLPEDQARAGGGVVLTFGSYRLGVINANSVVDCVLVVPSYITRVMFFANFVPKLAKHPRVADVHPVPDAFDPVVKLRHSGVTVDMLFASLQLTQVPISLKSITDEHIQGADEVTARSINGCRVAEHILDLVPEPETYRQTLRCIRLWAKRRGIYSSVQGYFGGITWALLVARVCQLYPNYVPSQLVNRFFRVFEKWNWKSPVHLCTPTDLSHIPGYEAFTVWNPKVNQWDKAHLMPTITPCFPAMNSTQNVCETTKRILLEEMKRGYTVVRKVEEGKAQWSEVWEPVGMFEEYPDYLVIEAERKEFSEGESPARPEDDALLMKWHGWVEARLRIFFTQIESVQGVVIRPYPATFHSETATPARTWLVMGLGYLGSKGAMPHGVVDLRPAVSEFIDVLRQWKHMEESDASKLIFRVKRVRKDQLDEELVCAQPDEKGVLIVKEEKAEKTELNGGDVKDEYPAPKRVKKES